jgi:hypothetical protein
MDLLPVRLSSSPIGSPHTAERECWIECLLRNPVNAGNAVADVLLSPVHGLVGAIEGSIG